MDDGLLSVTFFITCQRVRAGIVLLVHMGLCDNKYLVGLRAKLDSKVKNIEENCLCVVMGSWIYYFLKLNFC